MATIAFFDAQPGEISAAKKTLSGSTLLTSKKSVQDEDLAKFSSAEVLSCFVFSKLPAGTLARFPKLRLVATRSTGYDHIDIDECTRRGIAVCNVPNYGKHTVAEHAFALLLSLSRRMEPSLAATRRGSFETEGLTGFDLCGKTIGILGTGHIGQCAIRIAKGFGMEVLAYDAFPSETLAKELGFRYVPLKELLKKSDVVSIHVPSLPTTHHLINRKNINLMKKGAVLINTSRGDVIETAALAEAIRSGHLGGAGLDVLEEELLIKDKSRLMAARSKKQLEIAVKDYYLLDHPNVIVTPHNAFNTKEALGRILDQSLENITSFLKGKTINKVN